MTQANWSTRVPCPGGSGGGGVGWAAPASSALASTFGSGALSAVLGALACGAAGGAGGAILEIFTCRILPSSSPMVPRRDEGFVNRIVKMRAIGAYLAAW